MKKSLNQQIKPDHQTDNEKKIINMRREIDQLQNIIKNLRKTLDEKDMEQQQAIQGVETDKKNQIAQLKTIIFQMREKLELYQINSEKRIYDLKNEFQHELAFYQETIHVLRARLEERYGGESKEN